MDTDPQTLYIAPVDQSLPALRTLHNVTLLDGPNVVEQFTKQYGEMTSVEFTMAVGEPNIYGQTVEIQPTIQATTFLIGNTKCQQGTPIRYNLFSNPRLVGEAVGGAVTLGIGQHSAVSAAASTVTVAAANGQVTEQCARIVASTAQALTPT